MAAPASDLRDPVSLTLKTFVIGPQAQGRGYRVLEPAGHLFAGSGDLAMVLMEWSRTGEAEFAGCFPVRDPSPGAVLFRARHLGSATLGEIAFLHGALIGASDLARLGHRSELLLGHIRRPDGTTAFAEKQLRVKVDPSPPPRRDEDLLGLAWTDRIILAEDGADREELLRRALASIHPAEQRQRITGWVTSASLLPRGNLDLVRTSQLIVAGSSPAPELSSRLPARATEGGFVGTRARPPASWLAWSGLAERAAARADFAPLAPALEWRPAYAQLGGADAAEEGLRIASGVLPRDSMVALLKCLLVDHPPYAEAAARVVPEYVDALEKGGMGEDARRDLLDSADLLPPHVAAGLLGVAQPVLLAGLSGGTRRKLLGIAATGPAGGLLADRAARRAVARLMVQAIGSDDPEDSDVEIIERIVGRWPDEARSELVELTAPAPLETLFRKSAYFAPSLARSLLRRRYYDVGFLGEKPFVLSYALKAMRLMKT
jgi:hypothetical protein